jgi:peptidoglycan/xylan/chitin deacetylase (PgdA/CDA1 family)
MALELEKQLPLELAIVVPTFNESGNIVPLLEVRELVRDLAKRAARKLCRQAAGLPGGLNVARRLRRRSVAIVMYHGVIEQPLPIFNWTQLNREDFNAQIAFLSDEYRILPLAETLERLSRRLPLPERVVCITFDDGFRSNLRTAYPILLKHHAPATVFLVTSLIGTSRPPWPEQLYCSFATTNLLSIQFDGISIPLETSQDKTTAFVTIASRLKSLPVDEKEARLQQLQDRLGRFAEDYDAFAMLDWNEVEKLNAEGLVSFGSHTHTHQIMSRCSLEKQRFELLSSRKLMLEHVGNADLFAYPNGSPADYTRETKQLLSELGYGFALTAIRGLNTSETDVYELRRVGIGADMSFSRFQVRMLGW